jgi:hypothetical protein
MDIDYRFLGIRARSCRKRDFAGARHCGEAVASSTLRGFDSEMKSVVPSPYGMSHEL